MENSLILRRVRANVHALNSVSTLTQKDFKAVHNLTKLNDKITKIINHHPSNFTAQRND